MHRCKSSIPNENCWHSAYGDFCKFDQALFSILPAGTLDKVKITGAGDGLGTRLLVLYQDPPQSLCPDWAWGHLKVGCWQLHTFILAIVLSSIPYLLQHQILSSNCDCMHNVNHSFIARPHQRRETHGLGSRLCQLVQHTLEKRRSSASRNGRREERGIRYMCDMSAKDRGWLHVVYISPLHKQSRNIESGDNWCFFKTKYRICNVHSA